MKYKDDTYTLSSGRQFYSNLGILGLGNDGEVYEGYDGFVEMDGNAHFYGEDKYEKTPFTPKERQEIAEYMIEKWKSWSENQDRGHKGGRINQ